VSVLIVIGYGDEETARQSAAEVEELQRQMIVKLNGLAVVSVDEKGNNHIDTSNSIVGAGAAGGALFGSVFGLIFLVPFLGAAVGGAVGALWGSMRKHGIDDEFRRRVTDLLKPGTAAVVVMASELTEDKFATALSPFGGEILRTSLSDEAERELVEEIAAGGPGA
jgi:uncharacterized membrane protein